MNKKNGLSRAFDNNKHFFLKTPFGKLIDI